MASVVSKARALGSSASSSQQQLQRQLQEAQQEVAATREAARQSAAQGGNARLLHGPSFTPELYIFLLPQANTQILPSFPHPLPAASESRRALAAAESRTQDALAGARRYQLELQQLRPAVTESQDR